MATTDHVPVGAPSLIQGFLDGRLHHAGDIGNGGFGPALGLRRPRDEQYGLALNPDRGIVWTLEPGDEIVVLTRIEEPAG